MGCAIKCVIALSATLMIGAVLAAPQTQTFPVTVSSAVSSKLETVPVTFRVGVTNGLVERFDGQRFVPVPVKPYDFSRREKFIQVGVKLSPEQILNVRLKEFAVSEQQFASMTLSNAIEQLTQKIRRSDSTTSTPVSIVCSLRRTDIELPSFTVPQTNAWGAIQTLANVAKKALDEAAKKNGESGLGLPITVGIIDGRTILLMYEDDGAITRGYPVPDSFYRRFSTEAHFAAYVRKRLKFDEWGEVGFMRDIGKVRITCYASDLMARFEAEVYEPLLEQLLKPTQWTPVSCETGHRVQLYFRGANNGVFGGLRRYRACIREGVLQDDMLEICPVDSGMSDDKVIGPNRFSFVCAKDASGDGSNRPEVDECFLLYSHDGTVMRLEDDQVSPVEIEDFNALYAL